MNSEWIKADKPIYHKFNSIFHVVSWGLAILFFDWTLIIVMPFIGKTVFDISLNYFRHLWLGYISLPSNKGSKLDEWEYDVFEGDGLKAKLCYSLIIVIFNMFYWYAS
jgi:hypothetical protein